MDKIVITDEMIKELQEWEEQHKWSYGVVCKECKTPMAVELVYLGSYANGYKCECLNCKRIVGSEWALIRPKEV